MSRRVDLSALKRVARRLEPLGIKFAFTGGAVVGFLLDNPAIPFPRGTVDVDAIVEASTRIALSDLEDPLRKAGFRHDMSDGAPRCRWLLDGIKVDILPMLDPTGEWSSPWFEHALHTATIRELHGVRLPVVSAPCFLATKLDALADRGKGDYRISHDLEDIVAVVDGRAALYEELDSERSDLRKAVADAVRGLLGQPAFREALPGHLLADDASQARLPLLVSQLEQLADQA